MAKVLDAIPAAARNFGELLSRCLDHLGGDLFGEAAENFIDSVALVVPKYYQNFLMPRSASSGRFSSTNLEL